MTETSPHTALPASPAALALADTLTIQSFSHTWLPTAPAQRFQELFLMRPQWIREELVPFIAPLATSPSGIESLLLKHGRSLRARWSSTHAQVLLHGQLTPSASSTQVPCTLYQARVKYA